MEFQLAIESHLAWKHRFFAALRRGDPSVVAEDVQEDGTGCRLGCWIESRFGESPADPFVGRLKSLHGEFHRLAATLAQPELGRSASQQMLLEGRLQELSDQILESLGILRIHLGLPGKVETPAGPQS